MKKRALLASSLILPLAILWSGRSTSSQSSAGQAPPMQQPAPKASRTPTQTESDDDVVRISTNLVQVDVIVTDRHGVAVTDLKPEEVQIFEDGKPQKITHFSYVVADSANPAPTPKPIKPVDKNASPIPTAPPTIARPDQVRRTIALVVDDLGLSFQSFYYVRRALKKFVDEQMQPTDLVAVIRTAGGIGALQQFTSDKRQLYAAIDHLKWGANGRSGISPFAAMEDNSGRTEASLEAEEDLNRFREDVFTVGTLGAVRSVVDGLRELPGRKSVLLISDGFPIYRRDHPLENQRASEALNRLVDLAGRAAVVIYTMDASGLQTLGLTAADNTGGRSADQVQTFMTGRRNEAFERQEGLDVLAKETGGIAIRNTNDLGGGIKRVMDDQKGYYLIGYRPDEGTFDAKDGRRKFHKLSGKVTRSGKYSFRLRNGFYGISDEEVQTAANTPVRQLVRALISPFKSADVNLHLTSLFANDAKAGSLMRSLIHVNCKNLTFTDEPDGWHQSEFDVVAMTFGENGNLVAEPVSRTYKLRVRAGDYDTVLRDGLVYFLTVPIKKAGAYQLRAAVRDHGSQRVGSASQFVEVPDLSKNRLTLSGIVISGTDPKAASNSQAQGTPAIGTLPTDSQNNERQEYKRATSSAAVRQFHRGQVLDYGLVIYNAKVEKANPQPQLQLQIKIFRDGKPVFVGREQDFKLSGPSDLKRLGAAGGIQLGADMVPGEYVFQVIVRDLLADQKHRLATQWMDFEIVK